MLTLFTNAFSPFARKVAMALAYKGLEYETVDGLTHANRERLLAVNPRAEVPVLVGEIEKAGFKLDAAAEFMRNPADARDWNASPSAAGERRGTADRFVLKFRKP